MILNIIIFIAILIALVLVHEWGHFIAARRAGMRVDEFGFGFPPRLFSMRRQGTVFSFNALPIGGFVKIFGENANALKEPGSFASKSAGARAAVLAAGVVMNFIFAVIIFAIGYGVVGMPEQISDKEAQTRGIPVQILAVTPKSPAASADLRLGDSIIALDNKALQGVDDVQKYIESHRGSSILFEIKRGHEIITKEVQVRDKVPTGEGPTGIALGYTALTTFPWYQAIWEGGRLAFSILAFIFISIFELVRGLFIAGGPHADFAGPVGIATLTFQLKALGLPYLLRFIGLLSVNLAVINILPLPALDGGRLLFLIIGKFKGRPVSQRLEQTIHAIGFAFLILLIVAITAHDIWH